MFTSLKSLVSFSSSAIVHVSEPGDDQARPSQNNPPSKKKVAASSDKEMLNAMVKALKRKVHTYIDTYPMRVKLLPRVVLIYFFKNNR